MIRPASGPAAKADSGPWWSGGITTDQPAPTSDVICRTSYAESTEPVSWPGIDACWSAYDGEQYSAVESSADCHDTSFDGPGFTGPFGFSTVATAGMASPRVLVER